MDLSVRKKKTLRKRLRDVALYWGLPFAILEVVGAPVHPWPLLVLFAIPIFVVVTATAFLIELAVVKAGEHRTNRLC